MEKQYGIAYLDFRGKGFTDECPWILDDLSSSDATYLTAQLVTNGTAKKAVMFWYVDAIPEDATWSWVYDHKMVERTRECGGK